MINANSNLYKYLMSYVWTVGLLQEQVPDIAAGTVR